MQKPSSVLKALPLVGGIGTILLSFLGIISSLLMISTPEVFIEAFEEANLPTDGAYDFTDPEFIKMIGIGLLVFTVIGIILSILSFIGFGMAEKKPKAAGIIFLIVGIAQCLGYLGIQFYIFVVPAAILYIYPGIVFIKYGNYIAGNNNVASVNNANGYNPIDLEDNDFTEE